MRIVVLFESPAADDSVRDFIEAARKFNQGLDIRLRFLDVGFELREFPVTPDDPESPLRLSEMLRSFQPGITLVLGSGPGLLECAACAIKRGTPLACVLNGEADRTALGIANLARVVACRSQLATPPLREDITRFRLDEGRPLGEALVELLVKSVR